MVKAIIVAIMIASCSAFASGAYAADACLDVRSPWTCYGVLDFKIPVEGKDRVARMIRYSNGEVMFEIESANGFQRALIVPPVGIQFFAGLKSKEDLALDKNPFSFIDQGFDAIISLLQQSFPGGPQSVATSKEATVALVGNASARVILRRIDPQTLRYEAVVTGKRQLTASGVFRQGLLDPLPNSFSLKEWLSKEEGIKTLGAARTHKSQSALTGK